jgi:hypothetical protein
MIFKTRKTWLVTALLFTLTACGGGSDGGISEEVKQESIKKISSYASNSGEEPSKQDYINAGVNSEELKFVDIEELNDLVETKESTEVDSEAELRTLAQSIKDTTPPVITLKGKSTITIALNSTYNDAGATASDKGKKVDVSMDDSAVNSAIIGTYRVIYTAVDKVGNKATKVRVVKVVEDKTPPVITVTTPSVVKEGEDITPSAITDDGSKVTNDGIAINSSTPPGTYTINYHSVDSVGNRADESKDVTIKPLTIKELLTASSNGRGGVTYIAVGDSTRNYPGVNISFVTNYYPNQLDNIGVDFKNSAASGQRAYRWLDGDSSGAWYAYEETIKMIPTNYEAQRNYILEFSMGINDAKEKNKNEFTNILRKSIKQLQTDRKYMKILLVSPVPHANQARTTAVELEEVYKRIAKELNLPLVSARDILLNKYNSQRTSYYADSVHPNKEGSKVLFNHIFKTMATPSIYNLVKLQ